MTQWRDTYMPTKMLTALFILLTLCPSAVTSKTFDEERLEFTVQAAPWTLTLPKGGLVVERQQFKPDGRSAYFSMNDEKNKMTISFFIEPVENCKDSKACRDMVWKLGNPSWENPQNVVQSEIGDVSYFEFFMPSFRGVPVKQQNMYAEFVKEGFWVDMHISKVLYKPEEHELFERIIKSVKFEPKKSQPQKQAEHVYKASEVTKKPIIRSKPDAEYSPEALQNQVTGSVFLWVVFRADGEVTDIRTGSGLPFGLTEKAMEAARKIKFDPGEKDGRPVSIRMSVEYKFRIPKS